MLKLATMASKTLRLELMENIVISLFLGQIARF